MNEEEEDSTSAANSAATTAAGELVKSSRALSKRIISSLHSQYENVRALTSRKRSYLPLPVSIEKIRVEALQDLLLDIHQHTLMNLHIYQKNLQFWRSKIQGKEYVIGQEGPYFRNIEPFLEKVNNAGETDKIRVALCVLTYVRYYLAKFLSKVYKAIDEYTGSDASFSLLEKIQSSLVELDVSIATVHSTELGVKNKTMLDPLPLVKDLTTYITVVKSNVNMVDGQVSFLVRKYCKPRKLNESWKRYMGGAIAVSLLSLWFIYYGRQSGLFDYFLEDLAGALRKHVEKSVRPEVMESPHVQATKDYLQRMLLSFSKTRRQDFPEILDEEKAERMLFEIFNKQLKNPMKTLFTGDVLSAFIIQAQMIKSLTVGKLESYERIWAYGLHLTIFRAVPALLVSVGLILTSRAWSKKSKKFISRRLIYEVRKRIEQYLQGILLKRDKEDVDYLHGLVLYILDQFYNHTENEARANNEWESVREDIIALGKIQTQIECDRTMQRMLTTYEFLRDH